MNLAKLCIEGVSRVYVTSREGTKETNSGAVLLKNSLLTCYLILFVILTMAAPPNLGTFFFSFTLYPAHRVDRGDVLLRYSVPHFSPNYSIHCVLSGGTQRRGFTLVPERRNENVNK